MDRHELKSQVLRLWRWIAEIGREIDWRGASRLPRIPGQVTRLLVLFVAAAAGLVIAQSLLVPPTFGKYGHYRAVAIDEVRSAPIKYAGRLACAECHDDVMGVHSYARHQTVACETCHGPGVAHIADPGEATPIMPRERSFCPQCHGYEPSRPTGFPQIDPLTHNPLKACVSCHEPHTPEPPNPPSTCGACHGEIARVKAISHHVTLECVRCHETEDEHRDTPRLSRPTKPMTREFCSGCHAPDADSSPEIPRIDLETHGGRYVCWQCHYPHYPEVS